MSSFKLLITLYIISNLLLFSYALDEVPCKPQINLLINYYALYTTVDEFRPLEASKSALPK